MAQTIIGKLYQWTLHYGTVYLDDEGQKKAIFSGEPYQFDLHENDVFLMLSDELNHHGRKKYIVLFNGRKCKLLFDYEYQFKNCTVEVKNDND
jgi:hypothetical protein